MEEHGVTRPLDTQEHPFGEALQGSLEVVLEVQVQPAGSEPRIGRADEHPTPLAEELVEATEDGVAGNTHEDQPVLLAVVQQGADPVGHLVLHLLREILEVPRSGLGPAQGVGDTEIDGPLHHGIEHRGPAPVELEHPAPGPAHPVGHVQHLAQSVDVEVASGEGLELGYELLELELNVPTVPVQVGRGWSSVAGGGPGARDVHRDDGDVVHALPDLGPLQVGVAGVGQHRHGGRGDAAHGVLSAPQLQRVVGLHVAAHVGREAVVLREVEVLVRDPTHRRLQGVDLGEDGVEIEGVQDLVQASHHEDVGRLLVVRGGAGQAVEPIAEQGASVPGAPAHQLVVGSRHGHRLAPHAKSRFSTKVSSWICR